MFTKLDAAIAPKIENTLTPYDKAARLTLAFMLSGKLGSFDLTDQAHLQALESEMLEYEQVVLNATDTGDAGDLKNGQPTPVTQAPPPPAVQASVPAAKVAPPAPAKDPLPAGVPKSDDSATVKK